MEYYGLEKITSNNNEWPDNPNVYVLVAETLNTGEMIGGARIHIAKSEFPLPIEDAVRHMDPKITDLIKSYSKNGFVAESCGLWNSMYHKRIGLGIRLGRATISISNQLKVSTFMAIVGRPTLQSCRNLGYIENKKLGNQGAFPYPKKDMVAWTVGVLNSNTLETARLNDKKNMLQLRRRPNQIRKEQAGRLNLKIEYQLNLNT